jgi:hypothetical protein
MSRRYRWGTIGKEYAGRRCWRYWSRDILQTPAESVSPRGRPIQQKNAHKFRVIGRNRDAHVLVDDPTSLVSRFHLPCNARYHVGSPRRRAAGWNAGGKPGESPEGPEPRFPTASVIGLPTTRCRSLDVSYMDAASTLTRTALWNTYRRALRM